MGASTVQEPEEDLVYVGLDWCNNSGMYLDWYNVLNFNGKTRMIIRLSESLNI